MNPRTVWSEPPEAFAAHIVATGLKDPWEVTWAPDGFLWVTERPGKRIMLVDPADGRRKAILEIDEVQQKLGEPLDLLTGLPHGPDHGASRIVFGPDRKLYVSRGDVLVENFRPGVMARLGLDYASAKALNPRIVYCSVSGYGQSGPRRDWPAIDNIVQATSGMMSLGGEPDGPPMRVGFPVVDTLTGQTAAFAILAALFRRERGQGGEFLDVAMFDATVAFMTSAVVPYLVTGRALERTGNTGYSGQPTSAIFVARDERSLSLGVVQQRQFELLAHLLDRPRWLQDARFADPDARRANSAAMQRELSDVFRSRDAADWEAVLSEAGIPCGMVRDIDEAVSLPGLDSRGLRIPLRIPGLPDNEDVEVLGPGFPLTPGDASTLGPPPRHGEHTAEIRAWLDDAEADDQAAKQQ